MNPTISGVVGLGFLNQVRTLERLSMQGLEIKASWGGRVKLGDSCRGSL